MNKLFPAALLGVALLFTGCDKNDSPESTVKYVVPSFTLATDQTTGDFELSGPTYECEFDQINGEAEIEGKNIALPGGRYISFDADDMPYSMIPFYSEYGNLNAISVNSQLPPLDQGSANITNLNVKLYSGRFWVTNPNIGISELKSTSFFPVISFVADNVLVRTFWPDATFLGTTTTSYGEPVTNYENKQIGYRVIMNLKDKGKYTADVYLLNAKFAEAAPQISVIRLKELPVEFNASGISIKATDKIPEMIMSGNVTSSNGEATNYVPMPSFTFNEFSFAQTGDLTSATIRYKVAGKYSATFTGSYLPVSMKK